jgi:hypothetical protein
LTGGASAAASTPATAAGGSGAAGRTAAVAAAEARQRPGEAKDADDDQKLAPALSHTPSPAVAL